MQMVQGTVRQYPVRTVHGTVSSSTEDGSSGGGGLGNIIYAGTPSSRSTDIVYAGTPSSRSTDIVAGGNPASRPA